MHQAERLQFERVMDEFARWNAVPTCERSPAPAWWWGAAMAVLDVQEPMPAAWWRELGLHPGSCLAEGASVILSLFAEQTSVPGPSDFPSLAAPEHLLVRELHPLPSDDSAFQP
jgi:hypothetical protein